MRRFSIVNSLALLLAGCRVTSGQDEWQVMKDELFTLPSGTQSADVLLSKDAMYFAYVKAVSAGKCMSTMASDGPVFRNILHATLAEAAPVVAYVGVTDEGQIAVVADCRSREYLAIDNLSIASDGSIACFRARDEDGIRAVTWREGKFIESPNCARLEGPVCNAASHASVYSAEDAESWRLRWDGHQSPAFDFVGSCRLTFDGQKAIAIARKDGQFRIVEITRAGDFRESDEFDMIDVISLQVAPAGSSYFWSGVRDGVRTYYLGLEERCDLQNLELPVLYSRFGELLAYVVRQKDRQMVRTSRGVLGECDFVVQLLECENGKDVAFVKDDGGKQSLVAFGRTWGEFQAVLSPVVLSSQETVFYIAKSDNQLRAYIGSKDCGGIGMAGPITCDDSRGELVFLSLNDGKIVRWQIRRLSRPK